MMGPKVQDGIIFKIVAQMFEEIEKTKNEKNWFEMVITYFQIHNEQVKDLIMDDVK